MVDCQALLAIEWSRVGRWLWEGLAATIPNTWATHTAAKPTNFRHILWRLYLITVSYSSARLRVQLSMQCRLSMQLMIYSSQNSAIMSMAKAAGDKMAVILLFDESNHHLQEVWFHSWNFSYICNWAKIEAEWSIGTNHSVTFLKGIGCREKCKT